MNNEKAVFTFEKVNDTIITVVEALGGKREQEKEKHPLVGKFVKSKYEGDNEIWMKIVRVESDGILIVSRLPHMINDRMWRSHDQDNNFVAYCSSNLDLSDPRPYNPDRVKELVGKKVKHIPTGEYHEFVKSENPLCEVKGVAALYDKQSNACHLSKANALYADYDLSDYQNIEETLYIPDNIKFYEWEGDITLEVSEGIFLTLEVGKQGFLFCCDHTSPKPPIKCKLVPVKYEDIQVGDFVVPNGGVDSVTNFCMKHGDHKFCGIGAYGFLFNRDWYNEGSNLLKVVKA